MRQPTQTAAPTWRTFLGVVAFAVAVFWIACDDESPAETPAVKTTQPKCSFKKDTAVFPSESEWVGFHRNPQGWAWSKTTRFIDAGTPCRWMKIGSGMSVIQFVDGYWKGDTGYVSTADVSN